jgi:hypothetical protein
MRVIQRVQNVFARAFNDALNSNNRFATMESKIAEMAGHLDALGQTVARMSVLSPEEIAGLERMRADNRLLAGWQGREREQLVERANAVLAKLRPMKAVGFQKVRVGSVNDGGYVLLDDFDRVDVVFSFGVEWNADFDVAMAERSKPVFQFDHSIEKPPVEHPRIVWEKKMIAPQASETSESISHLFEIHHVGETRPNALLKMDIEHAEWAVLDATPVADLKKLTQITAEFHGFDYFTLRERMEVMERVIGKLSENFGVVHVHANNFAGVANYFGLTVPYVLEITFANRDLYQFEETNETFPGPLDSPCWPAMPDIRLGAFHY